MPLLDLFWTMLIFFMFFLWVWLVVTVFVDIFRSSDLGGWSKALWCLFVIVVPLLGVLIYLIARGSKMRDRAVADAQARDAATREYIRDAAGSGDSVADQLAKLKDLHDTGALTADEYAAQKAKLLA